MESEREDLPPLEAMRELELGSVIKPPFRDRMTVVEKVYHQPKDGEASCFETVFEQFLDSDESPYSRRTKVSEEWQELKYGWLTDDERPVGMVCVRNEEGRYLQRNPSDEERQVMSAKVLEIGTHDLAIHQVLPGQTARFTPVPEVPLYIRCRDGECSYTLFAVPR